MISVVVPLYNEEDNVAQLQREAGRGVGPDRTTSLIFVDDGSQDKTVEADRSPAGGAAARVREEQRPKRRDVCGESRPPRVT